MDGMAFVHSGIGMQNRKTRVFLCGFAGTNFCDWGNCLFFLGIDFC